MVVNIGSFSVHVWSSDHFGADREKGVTEGREAFGFTLNVDKRRLVYTGDVASTYCFLDQLKSGTTLLCEAMHVEWQKIAQIDDEYKFRQVVLTHPSPDMVDRLKLFCQNHENISLAEDGMEFNW